MNLVNRDYILLNNQKIPLESAGHDAWLNMNWILQENR